MLPRHRWNRAWLVAVLLLVAIGGSYYLYPITPVPLRKDLRLFPRTLGNWRGEDTDPSLAPFRIEGAHQEITRIYRDDAGRAVTVYIGYFELQEQGTELVNDAYKDFYRGEVVEIPIGSHQTYRVNQVVTRDGQESRVTLFWYDLNGRVVASLYRAKLTTMLDALTRGRTNGAVVAVSVLPGEPGNVQETLREQRAFLGELIATLRGYLPGATI